MSVVPMLQVTVVGRVEDADELISRLQAADVLHPVPLQVADVGGGHHAEERDAVELTAELMSVRKAIADHPAAARADHITHRAVEDVVARVKLLTDTIRKLRGELGGVEASLAEIEPWGDIEPEDLRALVEAGVPVRCCALTEAVWEALDLSRDLADWRIGWRIVERRGEEVYVIFFGPAAAELEFASQRLPPESATVLRARAEKLLQEITAAQLELGKYAGVLPEIDAELAALADRVEVLHCIDGTMIDGPVFAVRGYVPAVRQLALQSSLQGIAAAMRFADPEPGEEVPVDLHNGPLVKGFETIVRSFSGISYWEKDFSWAVSLLFVVFGSLCLLDGGYGVLLTITGGILRRQKGLRAFGQVFFFTGLVSVVVGALGGQYFGLVIGRDILVGAQPPTPLAAEPFACFIFSLVVGILGMACSYGMAIWQRGWKTAATGSFLMVGAAIHIAIAKSNPAWLFTPFVDAESAVALAATESVIGEYVALGLAVAGVGAWVLWPDPVFGEGKRAANVPWTLYAGLTGLAQDTMSHMRLFGIALSGSIMAMVVNQVGAQLPLPATILFAVIGHGAVFVLALLSLYIHTNRLIFLEFGSKCFDGGQLWYEPLRRRSPHAP